MKPSSTNTNQTQTPFIRYEPPTLVERGTLYDVTLNKRFDRSDGFKYTGHRITHTSP
jgi:hypothetical protein